MTLPPDVLRHHPEREPERRRPLPPPRDAGWPTAEDAEDDADPDPDVCAP